LELDDDDRKEVLSGKKEELSRGQKAVISKRRGLIRSKKSWTRSVLNRHKNMKLEDEAMQEALQEFYEGEGDDA
jgi:5'-3' exonuclease